jgi:hypothetical protein
MVLSSIKASTLTKSGAFIRSEEVSAVGRCLLCVGSATSEGPTRWISRKGRTMLSTVETSFEAGICMHLLNSMRPLTLVPLVMLFMPEEPFST